MNYIKSEILWDNSPEEFFRGSLGHCMYNYLVGLLLSKKLNMQFVHVEFTGSTRRFNPILNLHSLFPNIDEVSHRIGEKIQIDPYKMENIILDYETISGINNIHNIDYSNTLDFIKSKSDGENILFVIGGKEGTQFPGLLIEDSEWVVDLFQKAYWGKTTLESTIFSKNHTNIAIHIRRGDIKILKHPDRWKDNIFYIELIKEIREKVDNPKFFLFSEGEKSEFESFFNILDKDEDIYTFDMDPKEENKIKGSFNGDLNLILGGRDTDIFHHLVSSDILVTGQSTFSTIAAYFTKGQVIYVPCMNYARFDKFKSDRFINANDINKK